MSSPPLPPPPTAPATAAYATVDTGLSTAITLASYNKRTPRPLHNKRLPLLDLSPPLRMLNETYQSQELKSFNMHPSIASGGDFSKMLPHEPGLRIGGLTTKQLVPRKTLPQIP